ASAPVRPPKNKVSKIAPTSCHVAPGEEALTKAMFNPNPSRSPTVSSAAPPARTSRGRKTNHNNTHHTPTTAPHAPPPPPPPQGGGEGGAGPPPGAPRGETPR